MAIKKQYSKTKSVVKVSFEVESSSFSGNKLSLAGNFNNWDVESTILKKQKSGIYKITLEFEPGSELEFKYVVDNTMWINEENADKYVSTGVCEGSNSVIVI
ncbi:MAG: isoamylase early set domain-containing protein [Leadbetterella sp.]